MKQAVLTICVLSLFLFAATAYKLPEDDSELGALVDAKLNGDAEEMVLVGRILRLAAQDITQSHDDGLETEEYSHRGFWKKVKEAIIKAANNTKNFFKKVGKEVKQAVKEVAKAAAEAAIDTAKEKAKEKAIALVNKMFDKAVPSYSFPGSENNTDFIKYFCERMDFVGQRLVEQGENRLSL